MTKRKKPKPKKSVRLKERVESFLNSNVAAIKKIPPSEIRNLFEDLHIYQTELENQYDEMQKMQAELQKSEFRLKNFFTNLNDAAYETDASGKITYANRIAEVITGLPLGKILGKHFLPLFTKESQEVAIEVFQRTLKGESPEFELTFANGRICHFKNRPLMDKGNKIVGVFGIARDITDRKKVEEELRESEEKYRHLVSNMSDGLVVQDENGFITYANDKFCRIVGYKYSEVIGKRSIEFLDDHNRKIMIDEVSRCGKGLPERSYELDLIRKDGSTICVFISPKGIFDSKGISKGSFGVFTDVSLYKQVEEALNKVTEQLEEKVKQRTNEIEEKNVALKVLLSQRDDDKKKLEESIMSNVTELIMPNLIRLKNSKLSGKQQVELNVLEANLNEIVSPFASNVSSSYLKLTPTEFQVANFIKHGASSKEIAESLGLSRRTVDTHRYNIRKKFGLSGKGSNLRTFLSSLM